MPSLEHASFDVGQARALVKDLFVPNPLIYWADFLGSLTIGYAAAVVYLTAPLFSWQQIVCFLISGCALYRVGSYMHEIVHFRRNEMRGFRVAWNILAGIPMLTPTFFYECHNSHHNSHVYGTRDDGEYLPLSNGPLAEVLLFLSQVFLQPIFVFLRFAVLTPISFLHPRLRQWTLEWASSFVINLHHKRTIPEDAPRKLWAVMDVLCSIRASLIFVFVFAGLNHWSRVPMLYLLACLVLGLNYIRTLAAHRYLGEGESMSHQEQFFDSTNIRGGLLTELLCPLGMRYHALHHLFPALPYHNLGIAHRRLMRELPAESAYRDVEYPGYWSVIGELRQHMHHARKRAFAGSQRWHGRLSATDSTAVEPSATQRETAA